MNPVSEEAAAKEDDLPGIFMLAKGAMEQKFPHTVDARVWADEWVKTLSEHPAIAVDRDCMIGWFANAIMAGYDTATFRASEKPSPTATTEGQKSLAVGYFEARHESEFNGEPTPACVVYIYKDGQGRRCTQFVCTCESMGRDRNADADKIAKLLSGIGGEQCAPLIPPKSPSPPPVSPNPEAAEDSGEEEAEATNTSNGQNELPVDSLQDTSAQDAIDRSENEIHNPCPFCGSLNANVRLYNGGDMR